jgi:tRNA modification GTPase
METDATIAAIATPAGTGGIGIVRISGTEAIPIALSLFQRADRKFSPSLSVSGKPDSHRLYHGYVADPDTNRLIDEVLMVVMKAPRTYTREDVAEIHVHSGPAVLRAVLDLVIRSGARLAEPGEFTRRAFLNGRIDLTQAEGVIDLIKARTDRALDAAAAQIRGEMRDRVEAIRAAMKDILTDSEAAIDFPDEVGEEIDTGAAMDQVRRNIQIPLETLLTFYENGHIIREGLRVAVAGKPNVGKSSLMNRLIRKDRSIVTPFPGTTRDIIEESLSIQGVQVVISDTAGLHPAQDPVEKIGVERAYAHIRESDLVLFVTGAGSPLTPEDHHIREAIRHQPVLWVINKSDLGNIPDAPDSWKDMPCIRVSALYNQGIEDLKKQIAGLCLKTPFEREIPVVPNLRHKQAIQESLARVEAAIEGMENQIPFELINIDMRAAFDILGEVIGVTVRDDLLDQIFSEFCIGK